MSEGLQIRRYMDSRGDAVVEADDGEFCKVKDVERFHDIAQTKIGENMVLTAERDELRDKVEELTEYINTLEEEIRTLN